MANPPSDDNVLFLSAFNGTDGATSLATGEYTGFAPTFNGGAAIEAIGSTPISGSSTWPHVGFSTGTFLEWNDPTAGGITFPSITGITLGTEFYIELVWRMTSAGANDSIINVGPHTASDRMFDLFFTNTGRLDFFYSTNGTGFTSAGTVSTNNSTAFQRFVAIQALGGRIAVWYALWGSTPPPGPCELISPATKMLDFSPGNLHQSAEPLAFGRQVNGNFPSSGYQNWTYVVKEALYPDFPDSIDLPACGSTGLPRTTSCAPSVKTPIPDITIFNDEEYSKDYSLFFLQTTGAAMTFSATGLPTGLSIDETTGVISGSFTGEMEGSTHNVTVTASTSLCGAASDTFVITVGTTVAGGTSRCTLHSAS